MEGTALNETSQKAVTRQFLRGISQPISSTLQLDYPDETYTNLAKHVRRIEEVLARTQPPVEQVASVESTQNESRLDTLCNELKELKLLFQEHVNNPEPLDDVNVVSSKQSTPRLSTPRKCFSCGSTSHLQRDCSRAPPPMQSWGRRQGRSYRSAPNSHFGKPKDLLLVITVEGLDVASQCSLPRLN